MAEQTPYRHLHISGLGVAPKEFRAYPGGSSDKPIPPIANRAEHSEKLLDGLDRAVDRWVEYADAQKAAGLKANRRGMPITIESRPDIPLRVGQGRSGQGFALLNVRRKPMVNQDGGPEADQATFFATKSTLETFRRDLDAYGAFIGVVADDADEIPSNRGDKDKDKAPRRLPLFETAARIRPTTLLDLWTDRLDFYPRKRGDFVWEVWLRKDFQDTFEKAVGDLGLRPYGRPSEFIDTVVRGIIATPAQIQEIVRSSAAISGLRSASTFAPEEHLDQADDASAAIGTLAKRLAWPGRNAPVVSILDTGVHAHHPLLRGALPTSRLFAAEGFWGTGDHHGHGTKMAGIVLYNDLTEVMRDRGPVRVSTRLESVIVTAPTNAPPVPARDAIRRAVEAVEAVEKEKASRVYCLAQTAPGESVDGLPTSTSSVLDQLAYGDGEHTRLFFAAVGNVPHSASEPYQIGYYADRNAQFGIQAPAQALNALSVGAITLKRPRKQVAPVVATHGDLSPTSRTAQAWVKLHSNKPDIVMEGGNFVIEGDGLYCQPSSPHLVLTTARSGSSSPLALVGETSAATAAAAGLAGRLLARYPKFRMETVRALMVQSAEWTPAMMAQYQSARAAGIQRGDAIAQLIGRFGWGTPDEKRLFASAANALTLVVEDSLQPYREGEGSNIPLREMKYFRLPWPLTALRSLGSKRIEMRCTLSYFIEPDPHAADRDRLERYPSHRLRFDVKRYGEDEKQAQARVNSLAEGVETSEDTADDGWFVGPFGRNRGSLHHDIWQGPAHQLVERGGISVLPVRGWWGDTKRFDRLDRSVNFSLVVSIRTPETDGNDLYVETAAMIKPSLLVDAPAILET